MVTMEDERVLSPRAGVSLLTFRKFSIRSQNGPPFIIIALVVLQASGERKRAQKRKRGSRDKDRIIQEKAWEFFIEYTLCVI